MKRCSAALAFVLSSSSLGVLSGCVQEPRTPVQFELLRPNTKPQFLRTPWPSDLLRIHDGARNLDLTAFPDPFNSGALEDFLALFETAPGYARTSALYFHVDGGVDEASLPKTPEASLLPDASMFIVELAAPHRRIPLDWTTYPQGTSFLPKGSVAAQPVLGVVPDGPFALVVTRAATDLKGTHLGPDADLLSLMTCQPIAGLATQPDCTPYQQLVTTLGVPVSDIALLQIVTPQDATQGLRDAASVVRALPVPVVSALHKRARSTSPAYDIYDGIVTLNIFQAGTAPYEQLDGTSGGFVLDESGKPQPVHTEDVPFVLTVPKAPAPPAGYPIAINGHGTGGDLEGGLGNGPFAEAFQLASAGTCMLAISEPLHRTRLGYQVGQEEILTFNFFNPVAGRDNWRESALEKVQLVSVAKVLSVPGAVTGGADVPFDHDHVGYFGHSQGGITGALFVGVEDRIDGAFLSGAGGGFSTSLIEKTDPVVIADALRAALSIPKDEPLDLKHPILTALQTYVDPADPINYGAGWRHRSGHTPHLVMTSGQLDTFTPPRNHAALAGAFGLPLVKPVSHELDVLSLEGVNDVDGPIHGDLHADDGTPLTAGVLQYPNDGHFAVFDNPDAQKAMRDWFTSLVTDTASVPSVSVK